MKLGSEARTSLKSLLSGEIKDFADFMDKIERQVLVEAINQADGNMAAASRRLDLKRSTLQSKVGKFQIKLKTVSS